MPNPQRDIWHLRRRKACEAAEALTGIYTKQFPANLQSLADARKVRKVEFRAMFVDGALGVTEAGYEIFVGCDREQASTLNRLFAADGTGGLLPPHLQKRARFTIAHELAHTFFYDESSGAPQMKFEVNHPKTQKSLEYSCNHVAAALLLPRKLLEARLNQWVTPCPSILATLADNALVPRQVVIIRMKDLSNLHLPPVAAISVRRESDRVMVESLWCHYSLKSIFDHDCRGKTLAEVLRVKRPERMPDIFATSSTPAHPIVLPTESHGYRHLCTEDSNSPQTRTSQIVTVFKMDDFIR